MNKDQEEVSGLLAKCSDPDTGDENGELPITIAEGCPGSPPEASAEVVEATIDDLLSSHNSDDDAESRTRITFRMMVDGLCENFKIRMLDEDSDALDIDVLTAEFANHFRMAAISYRRAMRTLKG